METTNIFYIKDLTCVFLPCVKKVPVATLNPTLFFFFLLHSFWVILFSFKIKNLAFVILGSESSYRHTYVPLYIIMIYLYWLWTLKIRNNNLVKLWWMKYVIPAKYESRYIGITHGIFLGFWFLMRNSEKNKLPHEKWGKFDI